MTRLRRRRETRAVRIRIPERVEHGLFVSDEQTIVRVDNNNNSRGILRKTGRYVTRLRRRRETRAVRIRIPERVEHGLFVSDEQTIVRVDNNNNSRGILRKTGRYVTRTRDPHNVNVMRYQLR